MLRILERGQIETLAQREIPRIRPPDRADIFAARARRLLQLSDGNSIRDYLQLMAALAEAQHNALGSVDAMLPSAEQIAHARANGMPPIRAAGWLREKQWFHVLTQLCDELAARHDFPTTVREVCAGLGRLQGEQLERQADALLAALAAGAATPQATEIDVAAAPFVMAALQVYWLDLASRLPVGNPVAVDARGLCPTCGSRPVASVVRTDPRSQGYRYLHCALCATEWHMVRVTCSYCQSTQGITYQSIEGGPAAIRAECCDTCRTYRKILYQEKDSQVEPLADDLASLALDLLLAEAGYHRGSGNPLLWQSP
jgi:FdhE protein